ncbi:MAG: amino acid adenylation domain-containing protein [Dokdonella sp.]
MEEVWELLSELASKDVKLCVEESKLSCYAPKGLLTAELTNNIARLKPAIMEILRSGDGAAVVDGAGRETGAFPLSVGENSHYILQKLNPGRSHAVPICIKIGTAIDANRLAEAWDRVIDRFPILKTRIVEHEGAPLHHLDERCRSTIRHETLPLQTEAELIAHFQGKVLEPFDLHQGPLARITLFNWAGDQTGLFILIHHIIFDGFSTGILLRALFGAYRDLAHGVSKPAMRVASGFEPFVAWEAHMLTSTKGTQHSDFWKEQLRGELPSFRLLPDAPQPLPADYKPEIVIDVLPKSTSQWVRDFAKAHSLQHSALFLAAFQLLLYKYSNQNDIVVVMPVIVRPTKPFTEEIGYFFNIVPIRAKFEEPQLLTDFLRKTQMTMLNAVFHSGYPFPLMMNRQKVEGNTEFKVYYAYQEFANLDDSEFLSMREEFALARVEGFRQEAEGDFDLAFEVFDDGDEFRIHLQSNPELYPNETIRALLGHFCVLLEEIGKDPKRLIGQYSIATDTDRRRLREWNATDAEFPRDRCIHDFFLEQVAAGPDRPATSCDKRRLSYAELECETGLLALHLQSLGIRPDAIVALCVERSVDMMIGIMGIVRAGGAYMPIDPEYPDDRVSYMLEDSATRVVLTEAKFRDRMIALAGNGITVIDLDEQWPKLRGEAVARMERGEQLRCEVRANNVAYVIYTSGSTGKPKGVLVEHRALVNRIHWMQKKYSLRSSDVVVQKTPYCFDVSVWEFFWPPMTGASLTFAVPNGHSDVQYLEGLIKQASVTTLHYVPSMLHAFLDNAKGQCPGVRLIFCSGEALDRTSVDRYRAVFPNAELHNLYGPTEAAIDVTFYDCTRIEYPFVPIGAPIDNTQIHIVDEANNPQPVGVPGELHIAGVNLARGYLNRTELTQERFIANPFKPGTRMYKTGDLARWLEDGSIQYLGRIDAQVKIGGVRIETGEIEAHLNRHAAISESVVTARGPDGYKQLIAFYRSLDSARDELVRPTHADLRAHLLKTLPEYMIPAAFVSVASIPVTSNGKADRRALERIDVGLESSQEYVAPCNDTERALVEIWAQVFKGKGFVLEQALIGVNDNFFELGGNSLLATQLLYRIRTQLGVELPVRALFDRVTIGQLAELIASLRNDAGTRAESSVVVTIQAGTDLAPLFALPGVGGSVLTFRELSRALGTRQPFHALQAIGLDGNSSPPASVEATAAANIAQIRAVQSCGPYRFVGHSYGGVVAYDMARQLLEQGETVDYLALLDAATPAVLYAQHAADEFEDMRQLCAEMAEQGGKRFALSAAQLRAMPAAQLITVLGNHGIAVDRKQYETLYGVIQAGRRCYQAYQPRALPREINVLLFRATQQLAGAEEWPEDYGWNAVLKRPPQIHDVDADHYSLLRGAAVQSLTAALMSAVAPAAALMP